MKRRLIVGERIMYANGDVPVNCTFTVSVRGTLRPEDIRYALVKLQQKHPLLCAGITKDDKGMPWFTQNEKAPEIPVSIKERRSDDDWEQETARQFNLGFDLGKPPLARLVWLRSDTLSELMIVLPHCICDGTTIINLMQELLSLISEPDTPMEPYPMFGAVTELIPVEKQPAEKAIKKAKIFSGIATILLSLKTLGSKVTPNKSYMLHWQLDREASAQLVDWCKQQGVGIHATVGTAFLNAFRSIKGTKAKNKLICPADIRRYVDGIKADMMFAFAPIVELSLNKEQGFTEQARSMKTRLQEKVAAVNGCEMLAVSEYFHPAVNKMVRLLRSSKGSHDITFSNVGVIPLRKQYGALEVINAYSPNASFPWKNPNTLVVSSFDGRMDFTLLSSEGFLPQHEAMAIREAAMKLLFTCQQEPVPAVAVPS